MTFHCLFSALQRGAVIGLGVVGASLFSAPASAQLCTTTACADSVGTLSAFSTLLQSTEGMALLQANLAKIIEIYRTAAPEMQNLATINAQDPFAASTLR